MTQMDDVLFSDYLPFMKNGLEHDGSAEYVSNSHSNHTETTVEDKSVSEDASKSDPSQTENSGTVRLDDDEDDDEDFDGDDNDNKGNVGSTLSDESNDGTDDGTDTTDDDGELSNADSYAENGISDHQNATQDDDETDDKDYDGFDDDHDSSGDDNDDEPFLEITDLIYTPARWGNPLVVKEYKLVFFTLPKVACTEWKLLFRRMLGLPEWGKSIPRQGLHDPLKNDLMYLSNYTMEEAQEMLTSEEWTRAVFVREPKERVLSAFLNKFVQEPRFYIQKCCQLRFFSSFSDPNEERQRCKHKKNDGDFVYFLNRTLDCPNPHWTPQVEAIDSKWWHQMTFVGHMSDVATDAEKLLKQITSSTNGTSAWDDYGKTGWGVNGSTAFMVRDTARHATNAHDKLKKYYTPCTEKFVERHWAKEWNQNEFQFEKFHLFEEDSISDCDIY